MAALMRALHSGVNSTNSGSGSRSSKSSTTKSSGSTIWNLRKRSWISASAARRSSVSFSALRWELKLLKYIYFKRSMYRIKILEYLHLSSLLNFVESVSLA